MLSRASLILEQPRSLAASEVRRGETLSHLLCIVAFGDCCTLPRQKGEKEASKSVETRDKYFIHYSTFLLGSSSSFRLLFSHNEIIAAQGLDPFDLGICRGRDGGRSWRRPSNSHALRWLRAPSVGRIERGCYDGTVWIHGEVWSVVSFFMA